MSKKDRIAWECPACGRRYLWKWPKGEATPGPITMFCEDGCGRATRTDLVQIARNVWAAVWGGAR